MGIPRLPLPSQARVDWLALEREQHWAKKFHHVQSRLEGITAFEDSTIAYRLRRVEHACEEPIKGHLPAKTMQINAITTRPFVEPRLE